MARLSRPRKKKASEVTTEAPKKNTRRDFFLLLFICLNIFILASGYNTMDAISLGMYSLLCLALFSAYIKRRFSLSPKVQKYFDIFGMSSVVVAFFLFLYTIFHKFSS